MRKEIAHYQCIEILNYKVNHECALLKYRTNRINVLLYYYTAHQFSVITNRNQGSRGRQYMLYPQ
jgi:hypothetical protein